MPLYPVHHADLPSVVDLVNLAYRGGGEAWNTESGYIDGERMTLAMLRSDLADKPQALLLAWRDAADGPLLGCAWLEPAGAEVWYVGTVTVHPDAQDRGLGRQILTAAEDEARARGARRMRMTVVNVRTALIGWYERRGYVLTGEVLPFPYDDLRFGAPRRDDLAFVVLERPLE
jgi:GNAT superfamily N-acetyltransferase